MVLPSEAAVDALKEEVFEVETGDVIPEEGPLPPGSPPRASHLTKVRFIRARTPVLAVQCCMWTWVRVNTIRHTSFQRSQNSLQRLSATSVPIGGCRSLSIDARDVQLQILRVAGMGGLGCRGQRDETFRVAFPWKVP